MQVFCVPLVAYNEEQCISLEISWKDHSLMVEQPLLTGGQAILLSEEIAEEIIQALLQGQAVEIRIGRYASTISPEGFADAFYRYQKL